MYNVNTWNVLLTLSSSDNMRITSSPFETMPTCSMYTLRPLCIAAGDFRRTQERKLSAPSLKVNVNCFLALLLEVGPSKRHSENCIMWPSTHAPWYLSKLSGVTFSQAMVHKFFSSFGHDCNDDNVPLTICKSPYYVQDKSKP